MFRRCLPVPVRWLLLLAGLVCSAPCPATAKPAAPPEPQVLPYSGPKPPWRRRRRVGAGVLKVKGQGLMDLKAWPAEPPSPTDLSADRLARVIAFVCHDWMPKSRPKKYATWILESAAEHKVDPFLLTALMFRQSRCLPKEKGGFGMGLMMINPRMHGPHLNNKRYHYWVLVDGAWQKRDKPLGKYPFVPGALLRPRSAIHFAALLLSIYREQCPANDGAFGSLPHRHFVSHFVYGDRVKGAGPEDRVLRARRRIIQYYQELKSCDVLPDPETCVRQRSVNLKRNKKRRRAKKVACHRGSLPPEGAPTTCAAVKPPMCGSFGGVALRCPLDGPPRKITSGLGRDRANGKRYHRGLDFSSTAGEPIRAVADGRVIVAGLDRKRRSAKNIEPDLDRAAFRGAVTEALGDGEMGAGGLFVMIKHRAKEVLPTDEKGAEPGPFISAYMHLSTYVVHAGQQVKAGDIVGYVGRSGIKSSGAHLHFELRYRGKHLDPLDFLGPTIFPPTATYRGNWVIAEEKRVRRRRRIKRRRDYKAKIRAAKKAAAK